jgi:hypothetical protein
MQERQFSKAEEWEDWFQKVTSNEFRQYSMIIGYRVTNLLCLLQGYDFRTRGPCKERVQHTVSCLTSSLVLSGSIPDLLRVPGFAAERNRRFQIFPLSYTDSRFPNTYGRKLLRGFIFTT